MYLFLDTSSPDHCALVFSNEKKILLRKNIVQPQGKRIDVLYELSKALKKLRKTPQDITLFCVVIGPGYFSHLRTGIAIANSFHYALGTRITGISAQNFPSTFPDIQKCIALGISIMGQEEFLLPAYGKEPTITVKKRVQ